MKKTATILLSFLSVLVYSKTTNNKTSIRESKQGLHYIESSFIDSVDVANIRADELIPDRYFDFTFEKALTTFDYVNSRGDSNFEFTEGQTNFIELNYSFKFLNNLYVRTGVNLMEFDTASQDKMNGNLYGWETSYIGIGTGISWKVVSLNKVYTMLDSKIGFSTLLAAEQRINLQTFDIKSQEDFEGIHSFYSYGISIYFKVTDVITVGLRGSEFINAKKALGRFPRAFIENVRQKSKNIGLSLIISN